MNWLKKMWYSLFGNNTALLQLEVTYLASEVFKKRPALREPVLKAISEVDAVIASGNAISVFTIVDLFRGKVKTEDPVEQALIFAMADNVSVQLGQYLVKQNIVGRVAQLEQVRTVLGWVAAAARA